jgi:hypothetical protein
MGITEPRVSQGCVCVAWSDDRNPTIDGWHVVLYPTIMATPSCPTANLLLLAEGAFRRWVEREREREI